MNHVSKRLVRCAVFSALATVVAALSYRWFFPGYFHPFAIYHEDHFRYQAMSERSYGLLVYFEKYPRPIAYILIDLCGRLGPYYLLAPIFLLSFLNAGLIASYVERTFSRAIGIPFFSLFAALAFANPDFYVQLKADPFAVFALTFLLLIFHVWQNYVETGHLVHWIATAVLVIVFSLTKESYFCTLALFLLIRSVADRKRRLATFAILIWSLVSMGFAFHWNSTKWDVLQYRPGSHDTYYANLSIPSMVHGMVSLGASVFYPVIVVALCAILVLAWFRSRPVFVAGLASVSLGVVSWLPNATLPNHLEPQYSCLAISFVLAPFLLLSFLIPGRRAWQAITVRPVLLCTLRRFTLTNRLRRAGFGFRARRS